MEFKKTQPGTPISNTNWGKFFSPCIFGIALCLIALISSAIELEKSGGWSLIITIVAAPILIALVIADMVVKFIFKKILYVWIVELVVILLIVLVTLGTIG